MMVYGVCICKLTLLEWRHLLHDVYKLFVEEGQCWQTETALPLVNIQEVGVNRLCKAGPPHCLQFTLNPRYGKLMDDEGPVEPRADTELVFVEDSDKLTLDCSTSHWFVHAFATQ